MVVKLSPQRQKPVVEIVVMVTATITAAITRAARQATVAGSRKIVFALPASSSSFNSWASGSSLNACTSSLSSFQPIYWLR